MDNARTFLNSYECDNCGLYVTKEELYLKSCFYCELEHEKEIQENYDLSFLEDIEELHENEEWFKNV